MSFVRPLRVNDQVVDNVYEKLTTDGDRANFSAEAAGNRFMIRFSDTELELASGADKIVTINVPFNFLLNQNQLEVYWDITVRNTGSAPFDLGYTRLIDRATAEQNPSFNELQDVYYEEITSSQIQVHNVQNMSPRPILNSNFSDDGPGYNNAFLLSVPHTSLPATRDNKILVENQGDQSAIELLGPGDGIVFTTQTGKKLLARPDDGGGWTVNEI